MSRFTDQQCVTQDGQNLTFKTRPGLDLGAAAAAPGVIADAKAKLNKAVIAINAKPLSAEVKAMAARYFLTSASGPTSSELKTIQKVLTSTLTGLSGDVTLKIGKLVGRNDSDPNGVVRQVAGSKATKPHHNVVREMGSAKHFWQKDKQYVAHAIRIEDARLMSSLGVKTLIHEATHKYAGTNDYCYFRDADGVTPRSTFTSKTKALENADSYAYFTLAVGV